MELFDLDGTPVDKAIAMALVQMGFAVCVQSYAAGGFIWNILHRA